MNRIECLKKLHQRFKRYPINEETLDDYMDVIKQFPNDIVYFVSDYVRKNFKDLPTPAEFSKLCYDHNVKKNNFSVQNSESHLYTCEYYSEDECEYSKSHCRKAKCSEFEIKRSQAAFGKNFCDWHFEYHHAKSFENSPYKPRIKIMIEAMKKVKESGLTPHEYLKGKRIINYTKDSKNQ